MENNSSSTEQRMQLDDINLGVTIFEPNNEKIISREGDEENTLVIFGQDVVLEGEKVQGEQQLEVKVEDLDPETREKIEKRAEESKKKAEMEHGEIGG